MLYKIQKEDIPKASVVLSDAFRDDPLWNKIFLGESNIEQKFNACFESPVRYCYKFGEVYASSKNLEGIAALVPGKFSDMTFWRMIRSGAILSGMKMGKKAAKIMVPVFKPLQEDRNENMKGKSFIYLLAIGVSSEFQGQGYGGMILQELIDKSEKLRRSIYLETETKSNVNMYEKYGFKLIKKTTLPIVNQPMWEMVRETNS